MERVAHIFAGYGIAFFQVNVIASSGTLKLVVFADVREKELDKLVTELGKVPYALSVSLL